MATRPLNAEAVPVLEPIELELEHREAPLFGRVRQHASWSRGAFALDGAMLLAAGLAATLGSRVAGIIPIPGTWVVLYGIFVLLALHTRRMYSWRVHLQVLDDIRSVLTATVLACMALVTLRILLPGDVDQLAGQSIRLWAFSAFYLAAGRIALDWAQLNARRAGEVAKPTLIVGAGRVGRLAARRLQEHPEFGLRPVGFLDKEPLDDLGPARAGARRELGPRARDRAARHRARRRHLLHRAERGPPREIRRCRSSASTSRSSRACSRASPSGSLSSTSAACRCSPLAGPIPAAGSSPSSTSSTALVAFLLLVLTAPIFAVAAVGTLVSVGGPVFFRQPRVGRDGRRFEMLKFRSMRDRLRAGDPARPARGHRPRGHRGRRPPHALRRLPAAHLARRAAAAAQRGARAR